MLNITTIREMQVKLPRKCHLPSTKMAFNETKGKRKKKYGEIGTIVHCLWKL